MTMDVNPQATVKDTTTRIMGVNHIGLSVMDLNKVLAFYEEATNF